MRPKMTSGLIGPEWMDYDWAWQFIVIAPALRADVGQRLEATLPPGGGKWN